MAFKKICPVVATSLVWLLASCASIGPGAGTAAPPDLAAVPVRFILSFDDGPNGRLTDNPTEKILDTLAHNTTQNGIKAIFFLQTRSSDGGATRRGRALIRREFADGHVLALHDASHWGHRNHRSLNDAELVQALRDGITDLAPVLGRPVTLLRPPYWAYDARTLAAYASHGLTVLLTDISANDGKDWGFKASPRRFIHMAGEMRKVRERIDSGQIPAVDGVAPVVITFHDTNNYTAAHMQEYLQMIVDKARASGLTLSAQPFYNEATSMERAALVRGRDAAHRRDMVPWWWRWMLW
ncbi:MAG TPA: polysaccharide deacetylase family protein [Usitatibacteraceae bacterium]